MGATETKPAKEGQLIDDPKFEDYVRKTCQDASFHGMINKQSYNRIMSKLENFKIIRLAGTPLGERLFNILDDNVNGQIEAQQFQNTIVSLAKSKEQRILYTFRAYNSDQDGKIKEKDMLNLIEESWTAAFSLLGEQIYKQENVEMSAILAWAKKEFPQVQKHAKLLFQKYDTRKIGYLDEPAFKEYVLKNDLNEVTAYFDPFYVQIPLTLISFKQI